MSTEETHQYNEALVRAIRASIEFARDHGYCIEEMTLAVSVEEGRVCRCHFAPKAPGFGGDLSVLVDMISGQVTEFERGQ